MDLVAHFVPKLARWLAQRNVEVPSSQALDMIGEDLFSMHWSCQSSHYVSLDKRTFDGKNKKFNKSKQTTYFLGENYLKHIQRSLENKDADFFYNL